MLRYCSFSSPSLNLYHKFHSLWYRLETQVLLGAACLLLFSNALQADNGNAALYDVELLVTDESTLVRQQAFTEGMAEIFIRISGDSIVMDKLKKPPSSRYVKQFSYEPIESPETNAQGEVLNHRLKVQYNGSLMEKYLLDNGFPVWGEHRSDVVVWLVVRDGNNEYVLKDTDVSLIKSVANAALTRRGIPERWPLYDYKDRKKVSIADLRGGFQDQVVDASKRYSRGPALTASLSWNGSQWQSSWSLLMASGNRHWSLEDADYSRLINKAIDQAADAMGVVFAIKAANDDKALVTVQLDVQAVTSIEQYRHVENYLSDLSAVQVTKTLKVDGNSALFELLLRSSEDDFLNLIKNDAELIKAQAIKVKKDTLPEDTLAKDGLPTEASNQLVTQNPAEKTVTYQPVDPSEQIPLYHYKLIN